MTAPLGPYRALACAVVEDAVLKLRATHNAKDIAFFRSPKLSAFWIEAAGFDYDAIVSKLDAQGLLVPAPPKPKVTHRPHSAYRPETRAENLSASACARTA